MIQILGSIGLPPPMIIFCNQKKTADMVCRDIQRAGVSFPSSFLPLFVFVVTDQNSVFSPSNQFSATTLHSGKNQEQREAALQSLRDGEHKILVATDLVSFSSCFLSFTRLPADLSWSSRSLGWSWYRCTRRLACHQLADGEHH